VRDDTAAQFYSFRATASRVPSLVVDDECRSLRPIRRTGIFADDWEQASHNGELVHAVEAGKLARDQVSELGQVLAGSVPGRKTGEEITAFDSTGLAIQDLAVALAAIEGAGELDLPTLEL
jgi:alanine dehydrogenase